MDNNLFGKRLAECKGFHLSAVKENVNGKKFITLNPERGNRETAINIYISKRLSRMYAEGEDVNPFKTEISSYVDEESGEQRPWLVMASTMKTIEEVMAMFE